MEIKRQILKGKRESEGRIGDWPATLKTSDFAMERRPESPFSRGKVVDFPPEYEGLWTQLNLPWLIS